jgi:murein tripeptide amidase MpaA
LTSWYPGHVTTEIFGETFEGRPLKVMKISSGQFGRKNAVWIDGGIHAREWISPAVTSFIANEVIHQMVTSSGPATLMDWYIIPVLNPDGYVYSHTTDRMVFI